MANSEQTRESRNEGHHHRCGFRYVKSVSGEDRLKQFWRDAALVLGQARAWPAPISHRDDRLTQDKGGAGLEHPRQLAHDVAYVWYVVENAECYGEVGTAIGERYIAGYRRLEVLGRRAANLGAPPFLRRFKRNELIDLAGERLYVLPVCAA